MTSRKQVTSKTAFIWKIVLSEIVLTEDLSTVTFFNQAGSEPVEIYRKTKSKDELNMVMEKLAYQCGMVYKSTEASLLSTGMQPFIVQISVNG